MTEGVFEGAAHAVHADQQGHHRLHENNTGDPEARQFGAALNSFINAYARAVSPIGTPTVSDKDHARSMLSTADSHEALVAIMNQLKRGWTLLAPRRAPCRSRCANDRARTPHGCAIASNQMPTFGSEADAAAAAKAGKDQAGRPHHNQRTDGDLAVMPFVPDTARKPPARRAVASCRCAASGRAGAAARSCAGHIDWPRHPLVSTRVGRRPRAG